MDSAYLYERTKRDLFNFSMARHTDCQGYIVSMKHSGTHWLRFLVSLVISKTYDLPMPQNIESEDYICMPQSQSRYSGIPRLVASHQIPSPILTLPVIRNTFAFPDCVLLVRDPRLSLVACYHKHKHEHGLSFSDFLHVRQDLLFKQTRKRKFVNDIWWLIRFINSWSRMIELHGPKITLIRYEALRENTLENLTESLRRLALPIPGNDILNWCIEESSKENMAKKEKQEGHRQVVRADDPNPLTIFSEADKRFFLEAFERNCRSTLGYDLYSGW